MDGTVVAVCMSPGHTLGKPTQERIRLIAGIGVEGDAHAGATVKHTYLARRDGDRPNLRQIHLIHAELHDELERVGMGVSPGEMGENVTTRGVDLLALPAGAVLRIGAEAAVEVTGLRTPCAQLDRIHDGLMDAMVERGPVGEIVLKTGVMGVVVAGGEVVAGDRIVVELPPEPHRALEAV